MWGEGGIISTDSFNIPVNRLPVLILRLGSNPASADAMKNAFDQLGVGNEIIDLSVPENFMWYKSVFVSLGHYYANHSFTEAESYYLENFLNQKGNLYVEGVTTWNNDPQRSIHSKFNISKAVHAWYNLDSLIGVQGTLMHNINLDFVSANATANYYLEAIPPAEVFAENQTNSGLGIGVWYDQGNYKTIGTMTEFGSMADNGTSTRRDLMAKYMDFFEIPVNPVSIEDEALISTQRFELIPNPARHDAELIIEMPEKEMIHYQLFDITGHSNQSAPIQFFAGKGINRITLNFGQLLGAKYSKGLYVLKLTGSHFTKSLKIILSE